MSIWDKIKKPEFEEDEEMEQAPQPAKEHAPAQSGSSFGKGGAAALELKVVRPETFDAASSIADHLLNRRTVVLNLEATNKETAKRLIDFLSGVAYSIDGSVRRVATNTFVITPSNVGVSGETATETPKTAARNDIPEDIFG
ncbi:MAG: cell division protein SepF [Clostridia bacterium]|nr:cell division protein SepF [Clostridia bacterium]